MEAQPRTLQFIWTIIADLYGDYAKVRGKHNVDAQMRQLKTILNNYNFETLQSFFLHGL
jgi:hypothetical protein